MSKQNNSNVEFSKSNRQVFEPSDPAESTWKGVCRIGGVAALISALCSLITLTVVVILGGEPSTAYEYFTLLQKDRIVGILRLDFASVINVIQYYLIFFAFYAAFRRTNAAYSALAAILAFVGVTLWLATHSAFSMISLADQYAIATTDAQRSQLMSAGTAVIASDMWHSTGARFGGILLQSGGVLISFVMLRSKVFSKVTAYVGIMTHGLDLAHIIVGLFAPSLGIVLMAIAGPLYIIWFPMVSRRFFQLGARQKQPLSL